MKGHSRNQYGNCSDHPGEQNHEARGNRALTMTSLREHGLVWLVLTSTCVATVRASILVVVVGAAVASALVVVGADTVVETMHGVLVLM